MAFPNRHHTQEQPQLYRSPSVFGRTETQEEHGNWRINIEEKYTSTLLEEFHQKRCQYKCGLVEPVWVCANYGYYTIDHLNRSYNWGEISWSARKANQRHIRS